jgi:hypothetical protein
MDAKYKDQPVDLIHLPQHETQLSGWASEAQRLLFGATRPKPQSK